MSHGKKFHLSEITSRIVHLQAGYRDKKLNQSGGSWPTYMVWNLLILKLDQNKVNEYESLYQMSSESINMC